jgi:8-oxo-dGTP pyrophosphatase MutT (NUDIX family)
MSKSINTTVTCRDIEGNTYQVQLNQLSFRPAVYSIIVQDEKILLSKQWDGYDFPGGGIELGESTEDAVMREVKEETGLEVEVGKIVYANNSFFKLPFKGDFVHSIHLYFECEVVGGELSTSFFDMQEKEYADMPEWVALDRLDEIKIYSSINYRELLKNYLNT